MGYPVGNPDRSAVEGDALNCGLMLTCGAAHRRSVYDLLGLLHHFLLLKNVEARPRRDALQPLGFASVSLKTRPTWNVPYRLFQCWFSSRCGRGPRAYMQPKAALKPGYLAVGGSGLAIVILLPVISGSLGRRPCGGRASPGFTGLANASALASLHHYGCAAFRSDAIGVGVFPGSCPVIQSLTGVGFQESPADSPGPQTTT